MTTSGSPDRSRDRLSCRASTSCGSSLTAGAFEQKVDVRDDPRLAVPASEREQWTATLLELGAIYRDAASVVAATGKAAEAAPRGAAGDERREQYRVARELQTRVLTLYRAIGGSTGPLTADQRSQLEYFRSFLKVFEAKLKAA